MKICKTCGATENMRKNKGICRLCENKMRIKHRLIQKKFWQKFLKKELKLECQVCGYDKCFAAIDFHHRDPSKKEFQISYMINGCYTFNKTNVQKALTEIKKCDMLCSNCHKELHFNKENN